jgi:O-antigen/teichoic acid export membrane protein
VRPAPALDAAPPITPNAPRTPELTDARRVQANFFETLVFRFLATPLALLLVVLQSRYLHADGRGTFVLVVLTVTVVSRLFGQLGYAVTNRMQQHGLELRALVRRALALAVALGAAGTAAIVAWASVARGVGVVAGAIAAAALVPTIVTQSISGVLLGLGRVRLWNWIQILPQLLTLAVFVLLVVGLGGGVRAAIVAATAAWFATAAVALLTTRNEWRPFALEGLLDLLSLTLARLALVMGAVQVVNLVSYRIELFLLDGYRGIRAVGVYSISVQAAETIWVIAAAIATSVTAPAVHEDEQAAARLIARSALRGLVFSAGLAVVVGAGAPWVIPALLGDQFSGAARPLAFLLPGVVVYAPVTVLVVYLSVRRGQPRWSLAVSTIGLVVTTGAAVALIPRYGTTGAAAASTIGYTVAAVAAWGFFARLARYGIL